MGDLFGKIGTRPMQEGNKLRQVYSKTIERETEFVKMETSFNLEISQIKENPFIIYDQLVQSANKIAIQQIQMTIKGISEVTELTGNVVQSKGEFTIEDFYQSIEKVEIEFDATGRPLLPTIVGGPDFINKIFDTLKKSDLPEAQIRMDQIINKKRKQWNDRENSRKLVD